MNKRSFEQVRKEKSNHEPAPKLPMLPDEQIKLIRQVTKMLRDLSRFDSGRSQNVDKTH